MKKMKGYCLQIVTFFFFPVILQYEGYYLYKSIMFLPLVRITPEFLVRQPSPFLPPLLHNIASSACWTAE